jgi:hypothetical protein
VVKSGRGLKNGRCGQIFEKMVRGKKFFPLCVFLK